MSIKLGTNSFSLSAQQDLREVTSKLSKTYERLSSGLRINTASDDAAGLSVAESIKSDRKVFAQGVRNFNDGVSLLNVAEGAVQELSNIVIRVKELAEQAANGSYTMSQRAALDNEAQALSKEYTRIAQSTKFNDISIFNGSLQGLRLQGGLGIDGGIFQRLGGAIGDGTFGSTNAVSGFGFSNSTSADFNNDGFEDLVSQIGGDFYVNLGNGDGTFQSTISYATSALTTSQLLADDFNGDGNIDIGGLDNSTGTFHLVTGNGDGTFNASTTTSMTSGTSAIVSGDINEDGYSDLVISAGSNPAAVRVHYGSASGSFGTSQSFIIYASGTTPVASIALSDLNGDGNLDITAVNSTTSSISVLLGTGTGSFATYASYSAGTVTSITSGDYNGDGRDDIITAGGGAISVFLSNADGTLQARVSTAEATTSARVYTGDFNGDGIADIVHSGGAASNVKLGVGNGTFTLSQSTSSILGFTIGDFNSDGVQDLVTSGGFAAGNSRDGIGALLPFDLTSISGARQALPVLGLKLDQLSDVIGKIGAFQARASSAVSVLNAQLENFSMAESRIRDADIANETAKLVSYQILQKASTAVLAQANQQPGLALKLLEN